MLLLLTSSFDAEEEFILANISSAEEAEVRKSEFSGVSGHSCRLMPLPGSVRSSGEHRSRL